MTLAKKTLSLSSAVLLAGAMGVAQSSMSAPQDQDNSAASQAAGAKLRGCLSGSEGNYTLTDSNGTIYHLVGGGSQLSSSVGHEVEISGTPDAQRSSASDMSGNTASSFQVTGAKEVGTVCENGSPTGTTNPNSQPMSEKPPMTDQQPKGAPGEGTPPPEPQPHMMAMLQQPGSTDSSGMSSQSGAPSASPSTTDTQSQAPGSMANTPVTSQTPAESPSATGTKSQLGSGTSSPSAVSTQPVPSGTEAAPQAGTTGSTGANPATDVNNPNTGATATGTTGATTATPGATTTPQNVQNDQNKPLYERQATDIPWASHSGATTTTTTTNPDGSSSTTTTTTPQTEPHR